MAKKSNPSGTDSSGMKGGADMLAGLTTKNPKGIDASGMRTGHTINSESTRSGVGPGAPTLGPREA